MNANPDARLLGDATARRLAELYRVHECLWNAECPGYRSRPARNAAYRAIARQLDAASSREVARRINSLRNAYREELRRIGKTGSRGKECFRRGEPGTWFDTLDEFLGPVLRRQSCEKMEKMSSLDSFGSKEQLEVTTANQTLPEITKNRSTTSPSRKPAKPRVPGEEYTCFGEYVGAALSKMPFEYAISAETEIHRVIVKYRVYAMRKSAYAARSRGPGAGTRTSAPLALSGFNRGPGEKTRASSSDTDGNASESSAASISNSAPAKGNDS